LAESSDCYIQISGVSDEVLCLQKYLLLSLLKTECGLMEFNSTLHQNGLAKPASANFQGLQGSRILLIFLRGIYLYLYLS
jgi:hypothetical protein